MDHQLTQLLKAWKARDIKETGDHVYFKIGKRQKEIIKEFPLIVQVETSSYCNLVCLGCPQKDLTRPPRFMEPEIFKKIVDELSNYKSRVWLHYMGEPLMHPKIFDLIKYASEKLSYLGMSSNGVLLTPERIEKILDSGLHRFQISLDSLDQELLSQLRGGGNPEKIIENAHEFFRIKYRRGQKHPITSINYRDFKENLHQREKFAAHWKKILREPDFVLCFPYESYGGHESPEHATYMVPPKRKPCLRLWNKANILADGRLVTCDAMFDGQVIMGDTKSATIGKIWNSSKYYQRRQKHIEGRANELQICDVCDSWHRETGSVDFRNLTSATRHPSSLK